ncbi:KH homology domain-containing protein 1 [Tupaia chinensis]|uniref:KH homology domain-containing protein 1 n=1 Tax=Tupaia chinensis TaxID=246437 RepID=L8Y758_TUPCH|nr:KH homology domain-containing protein 1 [Tupaia chinensis]
MATSGKRLWWTVPENFFAPVVLDIEEDTEERIFGRDDTFLRCIEVHSHSLVQLEKWLTATGQTCVTVVGPFSVRQWLLDMISSVESHLPPSGPR